MTRVAVIGSGTWGTAVASLLGGKGHEVSLWAHSPEVAARINAEHRNPKHLSDIELPRTHATSSLGDAVCGAEAVVMVVPSAYLRQTAQNMAPHVSERTPVVVLSKGVEGQTGYTMLGVLRDVFSGERPYIFVRHFYACASIIGALICALCWDRLGANAAMLFGAAAIVVLRLLAAYYRWSLPKSDYHDEPQTTTAAQTNQDSEIPQ